MKKIVLLFVLFLGVTKAQIIPVTILETHPEVLCAGDTIQVRFVLNAPISPTQYFKIGIKLNKGNLTLIDTLFTGYLYQLNIVDTLQIGIVYSQKIKVPLQTPAGQWNVTGNIGMPNYQATFNVIKCSIGPTILSYEPDSVCPGDLVCVSLYNPNHDPFYFNWQTNGQFGVLTWVEVLTPKLTDPDTMAYCFITPKFLSESCGDAFIGIDLQSQIPFFIKCCNLVGIKENSPAHIQPEYYDIMGQKTNKHSGEVLLEKYPNQKGRWVMIEP